MSINSFVLKWCNLFSFMVFAYAVFQAISYYRAGTMDGSSFIFVTGLLSFSASVHLQQVFRDET